MNDHLEEIDFDEETSSTTGNNQKIIGLFTLFEWPGK